MKSNFCDNFFTSYLAHNNTTFQIFLLTFFIIDPNLMPNGLSENMFESKSKYDFGAMEDVNSSPATFHSDCP
ncbi:Protein of unknown function [Gryllus bimaculatus]|nr:Protein of unknown function [Gryllus bimaculatus]